MRRIYFLYALFLSTLGTLMANTEIAQKFDWDQLIITPRFHS
jgi:hypothetical protein